MKNGSNKKGIIFCLIGMFLILTAFWSWNMPHLINADKPFIDLSGSIGESIGNANAAYEKAILTPAPTSQPEVTVTPEPTEIPDINVTGDSVVRIVIGENAVSGSGEIIYIGDTKVSSPDEMLRVISGEEFEGKNFVLVDNYAETVIYREVKKALENSGIDFSSEKVE